MFSVGLYCPTAVVNMVMLVLPCSCNYPAFVFPAKNISAWLGHYRDIDDLRIGPDALAQPCSRQGNLALAMISKSGQCYGDGR
jgi:hypothetical protein